MTTIPELTLDLQKALTEIRLLHGPSHLEGTTSCAECCCAWPCETYSRALLQHLDGRWNIKGAQQHLEGQLFAVPSALRVVERHLSKLDSDNADEAITAIHQLCFVDELVVSAAVNGSGYSEIQFAARIGDSSSPLWSLAFMSRLTLRVFGPTLESGKSIFYRNLVSRSFGTFDADEILSWWRQLDCDKHSYFTTHLTGSDEEISEVILDMCEFTHRFAASNSLTAWS